jgi:hypothetical protein
MNAVQEFQVGQSNFLPEFGRTAGSINTVVCSGTNQFHGDGFYYFRNQAMNAQDPLASTKPDELRQQFGGSIGGPIRQGKAFYFINYDQQRCNFPLLVQDTNNVLTTRAPTLPANLTPQQQAQYTTDLAAFTAGVNYVRQQFPGGAPGGQLSRHPNQELGLAIPATESLAGPCPASFVPLVSVSSPAGACFFPYLSCHPCLPWPLLFSHYDSVTVKHALKCPTSSRGIHSLRPGTSA